MARVRDWLLPLLKILLDVLSKEGVIPGLSDEKKEEVAQKAAAQYLKDD